LALTVRARLGQHALDLSARRFPADLPVRRDILDAGAADQPVDHERLGGGETEQSGEQVGVRMRRGGRIRRKDERERRPSEGGPQRGPCWGDHDVE
jgi:hypothetical protein